MRAQEAETKLHHSSQRGIKMEEMYYRLDKEYNKLFQNYCTVEKILQKQAVLHQMQLSPNVRGKRSHQGGGFSQCGSSCLKDIVILLIF